MTRKTLKTYVTDNGQPYLVEESASYNVDCRKSFDDSALVYDLACQLDCDKLAEEEAYCLCLNNACKVVGLFKIGQGTVNASLMSPREIFQKALLLGAVNIVLWHNHPTGDPTPSHIDLQVTKQVKEGGELLWVKLLDHVIIGRGRYVSLREQGYL